MQVTYEDQFCAYTIEMRSYRDCIRVHMYTKTSAVSCMQPHHGGLVASYSSRRELYLSTAGFQLSSKFYASFFYKISLTLDIFQICSFMRFRYCYDEPKVPS